MGRDTRAIVNGVDPLMGEIKRQKKDIKMAIMAGLLCLYSYIVRL